MQPSWVQLASYWLIKRWWVERCLTFDLLLIVQDLLSIHLIWKSVEFWTRGKLLFISYEFLGLVRLSLSLFFAGFLIHRSCWLQYLQCSLMSSWRCCRLFVIISQLRVWLTALAYTEWAAPSHRSTSAYIYLLDVACWGWLMLLAIISFIDMQTTQPLGEQASGSLSWFSVNDGSSGIWVNPVCDSIFTIIYCYFDYNLLDLLSVCYWYCVV